MAMHRKIGNADVKAKLAFVAVDPRTFSDKNLYLVLRRVIAWEEERIKEGEITEFVAFVEDAQLPITPRARAVTNEFAIDGSIALTTAQIVQEKIKEKLFHQSEAFRKSGKKSTHPPRWLITPTLVLVIGGRRFLMDNVDLYLEREGLLRDDTFDLLKEVATLEASTPSSAGDYYSVDIAHKSFYRGYVEELGRVSGIRPSDDGDVTMTTAELLDRIAAEE
jgi:hypothetical protein